MKLVIKIEISNKNIVSDEAKSDINSNKNIQTDVILTDEISNKNIVSDETNSDINSNKNIQTDVILTDEISNKNIESDETNSDKIVIKMCKLIFLVIKKL